LATFFSYFPLHTYPPVPAQANTSLRVPTLWILLPRNPDVDLLSSDVECLKWQAYLALRDLTGIGVRWNVSPEGGLDGRLPNLHVPRSENSTDDGELLAAHRIPSWVDSRVDGGSDPLEGYKDQACKDESHAWVTLLEENVHAALLLAQKRPTSFLQLISPDPVAGRPVETFLNPPPAPLSGLGSLIPPYGARVSASTVELQYREAISSLSQRLGTDKWFLGSNAPTALDALVFAYLHSILHAKDNIRLEVTRRVNLVAWEWRVRSQVQAAFVHCS